MAHRLRSESVFLGDATIQAKLFHLGNYPGAALSPWPRDIVHGNIIRMISPQRTLAWLDEYEGCSDTQPQPRAYRRATMTVRLATGEGRHAWVYLYNLSVRFTRLLPHGRFL
jgi:gamma-glutamylcyclotransferase (GGCT)/AIG2-like uncharacterized protein YtfP